jgi:hypothetical protein
MKCWVVYTHSVYGSTFMLVHFHFSLVVCEWTMMQLPIHSFSADLWSVLKSLHLIWDFVQHFYFILLYHICVICMPGLENIIKVNGAVCWAFLCPCRCILPGPQKIHSNLRSLYSHYPSLVKLVCSCHFISLTSDVLNPMTAVHSSSGFVRDGRALTPGATGWGCQVPIKIKFVGRQVPHSPVVCPRCCEPSLCQFTVGNCTFCNW